MSHKSAILFSFVIGLQEVDFDNSTTPAVHEHLVLSKQVILARLRHNQSRKHIHISNCYVQLSDLQADDFRTVQVGIHSQAFNIIMYIESFI